MKNAASIVLHPSRLVQFKQLAASYGLNPAETIEQLLDEKMRAGVIPFETPGIRFEKEGDHVLVVVDGLAPIRLGFGHIEEMGEHIFKVATSDEPVKGFILTADEGWSWVIGRVGRGFVYVIKDAHGQEIKRTATRAMLLELDVQLNIARLGIPAVEYFASLDAMNEAMASAAAA